LEYPLVLVPVVWVWARSLARSPRARALESCFVHGLQGLRFKKWSRSYMPVPPTASHILIARLRTLAWALADAVHVSPSLHLTLPVLYSCTVCTDGCHSPIHVTSGQATRSHASLELARSRIDQQPLHLGFRVTGGSRQLLYHTLRANRSTHVGSTSCGTRASLQKSTSRFALGGTSVPNASRRALPATPASPPAPEPCGM
jgi:hypothetical protein